MARQRFETGRTAPEILSELNAVNYLTLKKVGENTQEKKEKRSY